MDQKLKAMGGKPSSSSGLICGKISVPLDRFAPTDTQRINVTFAVRPADGTSKGLDVMATGGPRPSSIASAESYASTYARGVLDRFDVVLIGVELLPEPLRIVVATRGAHVIWVGKPVRIQPGEHLRGRG